jgi:hypothetical protein
LADIVKYLNQDSSLQLSTELQNELFTSLPNDNFGSVKQEQDRLSLAEYMFDPFDQVCFGGNSSAANSASSHLEVSSVSRNDHPQSAFQPKQLPQQLVLQLPSTEKVSSLLASVEY